MGIYLNPGNDLFEMAVNSEIYVDKSMMIKITNSVIKTGDRHICISRPEKIRKINGGKYAFCLLQQRL